MADHACCELNVAATLVKNPLGGRKLLAKPLRRELLPATFAQAGLVSQRKLVSIGRDLQAKDSFGGNILILDRNGVGFSTPLRASDPIDLRTCKPLLRTRYAARIGIKHTGERLLRIESVMVLGFATHEVNHLQNVERRNIGWLFGR
jgi:hypothetical protein